MRRERRKWCKTNIWRRFLVIWSSVGLFSRSIQWFLFSLSVCVWSIIVNDLRVLQSRYHGSLSEGFPLAWTLTWYSSDPYKISKDLRQSYSQSCSYFCTAVYTTDFKYSSMQSSCSRVRRLHDGSSLILLCLRMQSSHVTMYAVHVLYICLRIVCMQSSSTVFVNSAGTRS